MTIEADVYAVEMWRYGRSWASQAVETLYFQLKCDAKRYMQKRAKNPAPTGIKKIRLRRARGVFDVETGDYEYTPGEVMEEVRFDEEN